ncbi:hypothetical protein LCM10_12825 [Rossellomorea aquimaris]|uniref:hypothetical protein n=1 Tax=Rossellomorea aquimaris TaxID=189382 RepID=UPI001CD24DD0|nr:hypothetical protein [Rossellomorea aquimaris]MCA1055874.1 hypothetical protein [Rossellomorea aquimaris]
MDIHRGSFLGRKRATRQYSAKACSYRLELLEKKIHEMDRTVHNLNRKLHRLQELAEANRLFQQRLHEK